MKAKWLVLKHDCDKVLFMNSFFKKMITKKTLSMSLYY